MAPSETRMIQVLVAEGILLYVAIMVYFGHGVWLWRSEKRAGPKLARAQATIIEMLGASQLVPREIKSLRGLSQQLQIKLISDIAPNLSGEHRKWLAAVAEDLGLAAHARAGCRSKRWWKRLEGARLLTMLGADEDVLAALLKDRHPEVRAQATEWSADHPTLGVTTSLIALLEDPKGLPPFAIRDALLRMGTTVVESLAEYIASHSGRRVEEALEVAAGLADHRFMEPALSLSRDESPRVRATVARLMGALGGNLAVETLVSLLEDREPQVRAAAARATGELGYWPSAGTLAGLLQDPNWEVRRETGVALRALGAPGNLLLRCSLSDPNPDAVEMARLVLDLSNPAESAAKA